MRWRRHDRQTQLIKPWSALLAVAAGAGLSAAIAMGSSTQLGETTTAPAFGVNTPVVAVSTIAGSSSYQTPEGVLTKWRFHSADEPDPGKIKLKVFEATADPAKYKVVADSSLKDLDPDKSYEFDERIPVQQGYLLGLYGQDDANLGISTPGQAANSIAQFGGGDLNVNEVGTATITVPQYKVSVAATVESDGDKDGYGDDTQDECPNDPKRHSNCPKPVLVKDNRRPAIALSFAKKQNVVRRRGAHVTVASDETGTVKATGTLSIGRARSSRSYGMLGVSQPITAGIKKTLEVRVGPRTRRKARRALRRHRKVRVYLRVTVTDPAKNRRSRTVAIKVKRRGR